MYKSVDNKIEFIQIIGITQDPDTLDYMVLTTLAQLGSLRNSLLIKKYNPNDKFVNLYSISEQLGAIHKLDMVHGDFHNGNILYFNHNYMVISDFGLCRPVESVAN